eukprot:g28590.t1
MRGMDWVNSQVRFPEVREFKTRGHRFKVRWKRFKMGLRGNLFMQTVIHVRNELPEVVEEAGTITTFKRLLDRLRLTRTFTHRPYGKEVPREQYWAMYEEIMKRNGGRPHWAK